MVSAAIFYFLVSLITGILAELSVRANKNMRKAIACLSIIVPATFAGLRYGIGTDYFVTYKPYYDYLAGNGSLLLVNRDSLDFGYYLLNVLVIKLGGNFQLVLFLASVITFYALRKAILPYKEKISLGLATFVFMLMYYQASFNIVRQMMAATIVLYAFQFIIKREPKHFVFWVFIAALFHKTAIVAFPFYLFSNVVIRKRYKLLIVAFYVVFFYAVFNFDRFTGLLNYIDSSGYYSNYLRKVSSFSFSVGLLIRTVPYIVSVLLMWKRIQGDRILGVFLNSFLLGSILRLIVYMTQFDADRIALYFLMPQVIFIPYLTKYYKKSWRDFCGVAILLGTTILLWYFDFIYMGRNATVPYTTIFN